MNERSVAAADVLECGGDAPPQTASILGEREQERRLREEADRRWRAFMLAPTLEICRALLRGEFVPVNRLDPEWVARLGRRPT